MLKLVCDKVAAEAEEAEEARDTESKTRTPHKVVGKNAVNYNIFGKLIAKNADIYTVFALSRRPVRHEAL